tara:strand:- start:3295 stop:3600 length:306 start_codon:yes stop_codon:yes gene_type:complete
MSNIADKKKVTDLIHMLGLKYKMTDKEINDLVESPFLFTYLKIRELDLNNVETEEELSNLKTNFLYRAFGKIYISSGLFSRFKKQKTEGRILNESKWKSKI